MDTPAQAAQVITSARAFSSLEAAERFLATLQPPEFIDLDDSTGQLWPDRVDRVDAGDTRP